MTANLALTAPYNLLYDDDWETPDIWTNFKPAGGEREETHYYLKGAEHVVEGSNQIRAVIDIAVEELRKQTLAVKLPERWQKDGVAAPTIAAKQKSADFVSDLHRQFSLLPKRISATVEGGVFLKYDDSPSDRELVIEIYNDLCVAAIVTCKKETISVLDVETQEDLSRIVASFRSR